MELTEIRLGDTVRLRNGETFDVRSKIIEYEDKDGKHPGPFVMAAGSFDRYLVSDLVEIVERNERICVYCGEGVTAKTPETDFCEMCFYSGRYFDGQRAGFSDKLSAIDGVKSAGPWHTGGGCFVYAVEFDDGRLVTLTEGGDPTLPEPGEPWGSILVAASETAWEEWNEEEIEFREGSWTDEQVVEEVAKLAAEVRS